jgi:predicted enzyme related to lactoylglutathione lyase
MLAHMIEVQRVDFVSVPVEAAGVEFVGETADTGVCHMAAFYDPDGNVLMLHRRYAVRTDR